MIDEYTAVFLGDKTPPAQFILLKRAPTKKLFPNLYTGIGGKREPEDQDIQQTALRELKEETGIEVPVVQFSKCIVQGEHARILNFFYGISNPELGLPECTEGTLEWVDIDKLLEKALIPTTLEIIREFQKRGFNTEKPWTLIVQETQEHGVIKTLDLLPVQEGINP